MTMQVLQEQGSFTQRERELGAIVSAYNDVTDRLKIAHERLIKEAARLREELRAKNAELRRRERLAALGEMAAGLAHEIRNPLGGIALYASMLEKELASQPKGRTAAGKISQGVRCLERLVCEILDFAQEDRLERQWCELGAILTAVEESVAPWVGQAGAALVMEESALQVRVYADAFRLRRALVNLVINGLQAAGPAGHVWLSARQLPAAEDLDGSVPQGDVQIEVWDDGPGVAPELLDRIFNPFFTTRADGTGLGLAIVHRIVESHGGVIKAGNRREGGARFVLRLPSPPDGR